MTPGAPCPPVPTTSQCSQLSSSNQSESETNTFNPHLQSIINYDEGSKWLCDNIKNLVLSNMEHCWAESFQPVTVHSLQLKILVAFPNGYEEILECILIYKYELIFKFLSFLTTTSSKG